LVMVDARNAIAHLLDNYTLAEMRALKEPLQLADMYDI
jgi:DNA-binding IscR family transcriptional regulator